MRFFIIFIAFVWVLGCSEDPEKGRYHSKGEKVSLVLPQGWKTQQVSSGLILSLFPQENKQDVYEERIELDISKANGKSLDDFYKKELENNEKMAKMKVDTFMEYKLEEKGETKAQNAIGKWLRYSSSSMQDDKKFRHTSVVFFFIKEDKIYKIVGTAIAKEFDRFEEHFWKAANSLRIG